MKRVIIIGGGVAGMSAAHELVLRGFEVHVYEKLAIPGGKARSIPVPNSGKDGRGDLPGEHGFRFFPRFYRHLPETMKQIPFDGNAKGVFDNLVDATNVTLTQFGKVSVQLFVRLPRTLPEMMKALEDMLGLSEGIDLRPGELEFFAKRLWQIWTSSYERREDEFERLSWWDYLDASNKSEGYQKFLAIGLSRSLVAADARKANTKVQGDVGIQLIQDAASPGVSSDRVLNAPTNEAWLTPWLKFLEQKGVVFHFKHSLHHFSVTNGRVSSVTVEDEHGNRLDVTGDYYLSAVPVEVMNYAMQNDSGILNADPSLGGIQSLATYVRWMNGLQFFLTRDVPVAHGHVIYLDSPWSITSISQRQFWDGYDFEKVGDGTVKGVFSVDISNWEADGVVHKKPANQCTPQEIADEVWAQLKMSLNVGGKVLIEDSDLHSWFLDPNLEWIDTPIEEMTHNPRYENNEPLLVAFINTWHLRPDVYTRIPNFFLAADYLRTNTQLACMEGANEAARRATNAILDAAKSKAKKCEIWKLKEPDFLILFRWHDSRRYQRGEPWQMDFPWYIELASRIYGRLRSIF